MDSWLCLLPWYPIPAGRVVGGGAPAPPRRRRASPLPYLGTKAQVRKEGKARFPLFCSALRLRRSLRRRPSSSFGTGLRYSPTSTQRPRQLHRASYRPALDLQR